MIFNYKWIYLYFYKPKSRESATCRFNVNMPLMIIIRSQCQVYWSYLSWRKKGTWNIQYESNFNWQLEENSKEWKTGRTDLVTSSRWTSYRRMGSPVRRNEGRRRDFFVNIPYDVHTRMTESMNVPFKILNMPIHLQKKKRDDNMKLESIENK